MARQHANIPLTGKLNTAVDPIKIQPNDFQELINLRPTDDAPKGVRGMTKINAAAASYLGVRTGYHFKKDQPTENHIIVQTNDVSAPATASRLIKSDNSAAIPNQDTFSTFLALDNNNPCYMTKAPDGAMAICNGTKNYIWGGNESRCNGFIVYDANNPDNIYDYTDAVTNTLTDAANVATMVTVGGGIDAYTKFLLHADNAATDSSGNGHDFTYPSASYSATEKKFGTHAFSTISVELTVADHADFDLSGGVWTFDCWARSTNFVAGARTLFCHYTDADNYMQLWIGTDGSVNFKIVTATTTVVSLGTAASVITVNQWHHIEVGENGDNYYIFVDGTLRAQVTDAESDKPLDYTGIISLARKYTGSASEYFVGQLDELRLSVGVCRHTASFTPPISAYSASSVCNLYIASTRPLKGIKPYIGTANTTAATVAGTYWNGSWTALASLTDNTSDSGVSLAVTGTITWTDTSSDAKVKIINNQQYYWYNFTFTGIDATTTIYYCTVDAAIQTIKDIWDGSYRTCLSCMTYTTTYSDYTLQVLRNDYMSTDTGTYVNISDMTSSQWIIVGFSERTMAVYLGLAEAWANTTAATACTVSYWNGSTWTSVGTLNDGTSQDSISLSRSGIISWDAPAEGSEFTWTPNNGTPLYYYKITFDKTIDNTDSKIYLNYVAGIPAQTQIHAYKFPLFWQNRLFLCGDQSGRKNMVRYSAGDTNCVFNGADSNEIPVDGDDELMAGATLFTRFGGDVYDSAILCKKSQTFLLDNDPDNASMFLVRTVSTSKGCVAPYTMKLCDIGFDIATNIRKHILIWLSDSGLMVFDGVSMGTISDYFQNIFDPLDTNYINRTYIDDSYGEYDPVEQEYILCVPIGATPTWKELHYKLKQQSPFWVSRGTGKALRCAFPVEDSNGNKYMYGGTNDGYIERLEYGTTMDGNNIAYTFRTPDINLTGTAIKRSRLHAIQLIGVAKTVTSSTITATHYVDGKTSGTTVSSTISPVNSGSRIFRAYLPMSGTQDGIFHSTKFTITTSDENRGFEPLLLTYLFEDIEEHVFD